MAMTPRARCDAESDDSLLSAPRSLNELVTCRFSYLTSTLAPVSADSLGAGSIGVCSTWPAMVRRAAAISAGVTRMEQAPRDRPGAKRPIWALLRRGGALSISLLPSRKDDLP